MESLVLRYYWESLKTLEGNFKLKAFPSYHMEWFLIQNLSISIIQCHLKLQNGQRTFKGISKLTKETRI